MPGVVRDGVRLHYTDAGHGPAVLFHTGAGGDSTMWQAAGYPDALPGWRHLLFDHRGHGRSDRPAELSAHRLDDYIADVIAVLDDAAVDRVAMVGYSDGARLTYALAARHPERVSAVVGIGGVDDPADRLESRRERAAQLRQLGTRSYVERMAAGEAEPPPAWLVESLANTSTEMFALELEGWADAHNEFADFPHIEAPTLIVCGEHENARGAAELASTSLPSGTAVVIPGFGHLTAFWRSDVTAPIISAFLAQHRPLAADLTPRVGPSPRYRRRP